MEKRQQIWLKVAAIDMLLLCYSFNMAVIGQMFDAIKKSYGLNIAQTSLLPAVQSVGGFAAVIICIAFMDSFNKQKVLVTAGVLYFILFILIGAITPLYILFSIFVFMGIFGGTLDTMTNAVMVDTAPRNTNRHVSLMHTLFAFGAVVSPLIAQQIHKTTGISGTFFVMGGFALVWALYSVIVFRNSVKQKYIKSKISFSSRMKEMISVYKKPGMIEVGVIAILFSCWQLTAMLYTSSMISGLSGSQADGALALSVLFIGMMISRLIYTRFSTRFSEGLVLAVGNFLGMVAWVIAILVPGLVLKIVLIGVTSFFCGNNFPVGIMAACKIAPQNTAAASGTVILGSYIALFFFTPSIGALADSMGLNNAMIFSAVPLLLLVPVALLLYKKMKTAKNQEFSKE